MKLVKVAELFPIENKSLIDLQSLHFVRSVRKLSGTTIFLVSAMDCYKYVSNRLLRRVYFKIYILNILLKILISAIDIEIDCKNREKKEERCEMGNQYIYMNGEFVEKEKAVVSVYDHGFYTETVYLKEFVVTVEMYFV